MITCEQLRRPVYDEDTDEFLGYTIYDERFPFTEREQLADDGTGEEYDLLVADVASVMNAAGVNLDRDTDARGRSVSDYLKDLRESIVSSDDGMNRHETWYEPTFQGQSVIIRWDGDTGFVYVTTAAGWSDYGAPEHVKALAGLGFEVVGTH